MITMSTLSRIESAYEYLLLKLDCVGLARFEDVKAPTSDELLNDFAEDSRACSVSTYG